MNLSWDEMLGNAIAFSNSWGNFNGLERQHYQQFVRELLACFGVKSDEVGVFQEKAGTKWVDYLWPGMVGIEMKSPGESLAKAEKQLFNYLPKISAESMPKYLVVSDFINIRIYRLSTKTFKEFKTSRLRDYIWWFADIAGYITERIIDDQVEVNVKAAEKMAQLHDALNNLGYSGHDLRVYLVRLLFCLFAEDTGIFPPNSFTEYIQGSKTDGSDLSSRILKLFEFLNLSNEVRDNRKLLFNGVLQFQYIDGNLFKDRLPEAIFNTKMRKILLDCANFNWSKISPAIFGAMFQGVMDPKQRREIGAHYTSEENILKLINPLFMDDLWKKFDLVKTDPRKLKEFHDDISELKFLDPACGCGNFLIITYRELRRLEIEILKMRYSIKQRVLDISSYQKVNIEQFYGIEIDDFPCQIAQVGMWLMDHKMNLMVSEQFGTYYSRLPLLQSATIVHGNALRLEWGEVCKPDYIFGNPPFVGYSNQSKEQKEDILRVCGLGKVDYVVAWYFKAVKFIQNTDIKCAFVSTNSITQGGQAAAMWKPLMSQGAHINFGAPTFKWLNEAKGKAAVHCVIIGFSLEKTDPNINPYLVEAPTVFIESRRKPICHAPNIVWGNKPVDGGHLMLTSEEKNEIINSDSHAEKYIRRIYGSEEYINNIERYCLWLVDANPAELRKIPLIMERVDKVRRFRLSSAKLATRKYAEFPTRFMEVRQPDTNYILIPRVSSEKRLYIPMGFVSAEIIVNDAVHIMPKGSLYHFGILTSSVHMAWVRAVCGRLKSDYRYSKDIVYNNFPWPNVTKSQEKEIEKLARDVLDARELFPESSLADLYDPLATPQSLQNAHRSLDRAVIKLYGFRGKDMTDSVLVGKLMELYQSITVNEVKLV
jgi:hypothetical protein